ncbi:MAG: hypothetical protein ACI8SE_000067 [Bacteroidia bacterium]|jgi:hypothetical protein
MPKLNISIKIAVGVFVFFQSNYAISQVLDTIPPVVELNTEDTVYHEVNEPYFSVKIYVTDNVSDSSKMSITANSNLNQFQLGIYTERFTVTDSAGNQTLKIRWVIVGDTTPPTITSEYPVAKFNYDKKEDLLDLLTFKDNYIASSILKSRVEIIYNNYQWNEEGVYDAMFVPSDEAGNYSMSYTLIIVVYGPIISVQNTTVNSFKIYPNPVSDILKVSIPTITDMKGDITIYNDLGEKVLIKPITDNLIDIETTHLPSGLYTVRLCTNEDFQTRRLIIQ